MSGHSGFVSAGNRIPAINPPQVGGVENHANPPVNVPGGQPQGHAGNVQANPPNARSLAQKLDVMLLEAAKLSARSVDAKSIRKVTEVPGLGKGERKALSAAADKAQKTMKAIAGFTGRQIAEAFTTDAKGVFSWTNSAAAKAIRAAIDAQGELSERLHALAERPEAVGAACDTVLELALQCDRRQTEIASLAMQLADALDDPDAAERLDARLASLLPRQALSMHGNEAAIERMKAALQPLADRLESFASRPGASLSSEEFMAYAVELQEARKTIARAAKEGFPTPDGGRVIPDRDFLSRLAGLADGAEKLLADARRNIGGAMLRQFVGQSLGMRERFPLFAKENMGTVLNFSPTLCQAVQLRRAIGKAAREYLEDPKSQEKRQEILNLAQRYAALDTDDLKLGISSLKLNYGNWMKDAAWKELEIFFHPKTRTLKTQVAHFFQMVKTVRKKMTPEQFLSTGSARALAEGKLAFTSLVEARVHGMSDADVDPMLDDSRLASSKTLGAGQANTVKLVTYTDGSQRVFKPEALGRQGMETLSLSKDYAPAQQVAQLNLATQTAANLLGLGDVVPKCSVGMHGGDYGLFMEKAPGLPATQFARGAEPPAGSLSAEEVASLPADQHAKVVGGLLRGMNRLEWLDLVTGQGDRHAGNYMIDVKRTADPPGDFTVSVKGIDNDMCFPAYRTGLRTYVLDAKAAENFREGCEYIVSKYPKKLQNQIRQRLNTDPGVQGGPDGTLVIDTSKFRAGELHFAARRAIGMHGASLPDFIDEDLYRHLLDLRSGEKRDAYRADLADRLPPEAVESAMKRLDEAIIHAIKLNSEEKVVSAADFAKRSVQKQLLTRELNAGSPVKPLGDFQLREEPYVNKEQAKKDIVRRANTQVKSLFVRDLFGKITKPDWFA